MEFENTFTVEAAIDEVYDALLDVERVTPAMPGAKVLEKTSDDVYKVAIKVKLGPVTMTYRGDVTVVERDPEKHSAVLDVKAKEARGQGSANAKVSMSLDAADGATRGTMNTSVQLSGKAAAMSRGVNWLQALEPSELLTNRVVTPAVRARAAMASSLPALERESSQIHMPLPSKAVPACAGTSSLRRGWPLSPAIPRPACGWSPALRRFTRSCGR